MSQNRRYDSHGNELFKGESVRVDGRYCYRWTNKQTGKREQLYANSLEELRKKEYTKFKDLSFLHIENAVSLNDMYNRWITTKAFLRDSTFSNYQYLYNKHILNSDIGYKDITEITNEEIKQFYRYLHKEYVNPKTGKIGLEYFSIENINQMLYQVFKFAIQQRILVVNPTSSIMKDMGASGEIKKKKFNVKVLTVREEQALREYYKTSALPKKWLNYIIILLYTGLRVGEFTCLTWDDIDFEENVIKVNKTLSYRKRESGKCEFKVEPPKTNSGNRYIPMLPEVTDIFKELKTQKQKATVKLDGYSDFIFINKDNGIYNSRMINLAIDRILKDYHKSFCDNKNYIKIKKFTCHTLRHSFASRFYSETKDIETCRYLLGNSDTSTVFRHYINVPHEQIARSFSQFTNKITNI